MTKIGKLVQSLREECGTCDPFDICEVKRIGVVFCDLPCYVKGFYLKMDANQIVFINQELDEREARVVCGHELGHAMLHSDYNALYLHTETLLNCERYENQADTFCACLLIEEACWDDAEAVTAQGIAQCAGVPERLAHLWLAEKGSMVTWKQEQ